MTEQEHSPVMLTECIQGLNIKSNGTYLDATFGRGGHSQEILSNLDQDGVLWVLDQDPEAIAVAEILAKKDSRVRVIASRFSGVADALPESVSFDGVLFDLGISSPQIDQAHRGFSFQQDGPLDMRMNNGHGMSAADWINRADKEEITWVLEAYGEEKKAEEIANKIIEKRQQEPIVTTKNLVEIILSAITQMQKGKHPATKVFQAIRMHINAELDEIREGLPEVLMKLSPAARVVIMSYHSLEHKMVSDVLKSIKSRKEYCGMVENIPKLKKVGHAIRACRSEVLNNRRARSALLRIWEVKS